MLACCPEKCVRSVRRRGDDVQLVLFARLGKEKRSSHFSLLLAVKPDRAIIYFRFKKVFVVSSVMLIPTSVRSFICLEGCQTFDTYEGYMFRMNVCLFVFFFFSSTKKHALDRCFRAKIRPEKVADKGIA